MGKYEKNKTEFIPIRVEPELKAQLIAEAAELGITLSEYIRRLITGSVEWDTGKVTFKRVVEHGELARLERLP